MIKHIVAAHVTVCKNIHDLHGQGGIPVFGVYQGRQVLLSAVFSVVDAQFGNNIAKVAELVHSVREFDGFPDGSNLVAE